MNKKKSSKLDYNNSNAYKISVLFIVLAFCFLVFILRMLYIASVDRKLPSLTTSKIDSAIRGRIVTADGFDLAISEKTYKASVYVENIDPEKKNLFIKLFAIYGDFDEAEIKAKLKNKRGVIVLSNDIDEKKAKRLKELKYKLNVRKVFRNFEDKEGRVINYGLSIIESGEKRRYVYNDSLSPILGYIKKNENKKDSTRIEGIKGLEKYYDSNLEAIQSEKESGFRDVGSNIILDGDYIHRDRIDGLNLHLHIPLKLQQSIERLLDQKKIELNAKEIQVGILEAKNGKLLTLATSNRFNPNDIKVSDYPFLNANFSEFSFEAGSVLKPIVFSILLDDNLITLDDTIYAENGKYKILDRVITDSHPFLDITMSDIVVHSSNIGMAKIAQRLSADRYHDRLVEFGFSQKTNIDLPYEKVGIIPDINTLQNEVYKATVSYGYGLQVTFLQLLRAYNVFINDGLMLEPKIADYVAFEDKGYIIDSNLSKSVIKPQTAQTMRDILIKTVTDGTGRKTQIDGLTIGGKTGTAHIARDGAYTSSYNSSFFGFVSDDKNATYTIGVSVNEPSGKYFASETAALVFKEIIQTMLNQGYLVKSKNR